MINLSTDYDVPSGGIRASSNGLREQGRAAVEFYTQMEPDYVHAGVPE